MLYLHSITGYYQNEKDVATDSDDPFSDEMERMLDQVIPSASEHDVSNRNHQHPHYINQVNGLSSGMAVINPDYFEDEHQVWKPKNQMHNGYLSVPNTTSSPIHLSNKDGIALQYKSLNGAVSPSPNTSQTVGTKVTGPGMQCQAKV